MIHVIRGEMPSSLRPSFARAKSALAIQVSEKQNKRLQFRADVWNQADIELETIFNGKCAYCETAFYEAGSSRIEHFRPKSGAINADGSVDKDHYWWLAYEWENLLITCNTCNMTKKSHFPVSGQRIARGRSVASESPLLLDPCVDEPQDHLAFADDGSVRGITTRGAATIKVIGLDRPGLIRDRQRTILDLYGTLASLGTLDSQAENFRRVKMYVEAALSSPAPYAGAARQAMGRWLDRVDKKSAKFVRDNFELIGVNSQKTEKALVNDVELARTVFVQSIEINNFRSIEKLKINLKLPQEESASWLSLLGENGSGKSSILQALALTLVGKKGLQSLSSEVPGFSTDDLIRHGFDSATIRLILTGSPGRISLTLKRGGSSRFSFGSEGVPSMVLAYGATRLLPRSAQSGSLASSSKAEQRVVNLLDPFKPLVDADGWLCSLTEEEFRMAGWTLCDLLQLDTQASKFYRSKGKVFLSHNDRDVSLPFLSAGYQCIVALATDIMQASPRGILDKSQITGIVMIDEIDVHLHPRWKMEVVSSLRRSFPSVQFVVTTHEPLSLRGCKLGEVILLEESEGRVVSVTDLPSPEGLRVDQLLTSKFFGLHSTSDPDIEKLFGRYYMLLSKAVLSPEENGELLKMQKHVRRYGVLGYTRRDQIAYECIDLYLASEKKRSKRQGKALMNATIKKVVDIWEEMEDWQEGRG